MTINLGWMNRANCKGKLDYFFPKYSERPEAERRRTAIAKNICSQCEVKIECRDYGRINGEVGIWGGETDEERHMSGFLTNDPTIKRRFYNRRKTEEMSRGSTPTR
jgi:WhiB family redox-sensing transcriptional regulator